MHNVSCVCYISQPQLNFKDTWERPGERRNLYDERSRKDQQLTAAGAGTGTHNKRTDRESPQAQRHVLCQNKKLP